MLTGGSDLAGMLCERGVNTLLLFGVPESVAGWKGRYEAVQPLWPWQTLSVGGDGGGNATVHLSALPRDHPLNPMTGANFWR